MGMNPHASTPPAPQTSLSSVYTLEAIVYAGLNETINLGPLLGFFFFFGLSLAASRNVRCMPNG